MKNAIKSLVAPVVKGARDLRMAQIYLMRRNPAYFNPEARLLEAKHPIGSDEGSVIVIGGSIPQKWPGIEDLLHPIARVVNKAIFGAQLHHLLHNLEMLVIRHNPRAVIVYSGNDLGPHTGKKKEGVLSEYKELISRLTSHGIETFIITTMPSPQRWDEWSKIEWVNQRLVEEYRDDEHTNVINITNVFLRSDGSLTRGNFLEDGLHLVPIVYNASLRPLISREVRAALKG